MIWLGIAAAVFTIDFCIKKWAEKNLKGKTRKQIGKTGFSLKLVHNKGFAGSKMDHNPALVKTVHAIVLFFFGFLCIVMGCFKKGNELQAFGLALVLGGGASNLYDRIKQDYVTDYLGLPVAKKLVFNISELCIFAGTLMAIIGELKK